MYEKNEVSIDKHVYMLIYMLKSRIQMILFGIYHENESLFGL